MASLLKGKVTAVTGGATGIGRAITIEFIKQGARVAVNHLGDAASISHVETLRKEVSSIIQEDVESVLIDFGGDISQAGTADDFVAAVIAKWGELNVMVANAGIARFHDFLSTPDDWIQQHMEVNIGGCYYTTRAAGKAMQEQGKGGSIIGMASISALCGSGGLVHYTPTKAAVLNIMQSAAVALGPYGVRCNALLPGTIETQLNKDDLAVPEKRQAVLDRTPLRRVGKTEDLAGPAVFLASDMSLYCSGAQILVDGGYFINQQ